MASITEEDFDKLVEHTVRIDLTDGTALLYPLSVAEKQSLIEHMRQLAHGFNIEKRDVRIISFRTTPERVVFINTAFILRLIFCFDNRGEAPENVYRDNFNVLETDEKNEGGYVTKKEEDEESLYLPQAIIKLVKPVGYQDTDILTFSSLDPYSFSGFDVEIEGPEDEQREFIELIDEDGENNFLPLKQIMCMEVEAEQVDDENMEEEE